MRLSAKFKVTNSHLKEQLLRWAAAQEICCLLNSNREKQFFTDAYSQYDFLVAAGAVSELENRSGDSFNDLKVFHQQTNDWLFGYFTYDLKNEIENLTSDNFDSLNFPKVHFFQPRYLLKPHNGFLVIEYLPHYDDESSVRSVFAEITDIEPMTFSANVEPINIHPRVSKGKYLLTVNKIKQHLQQGDIYEMNYCMEFFSENVAVDVAEIYRKLNEMSPMPFSCYYKNKKHHLACASPERFLAKRDAKIISQPIKGTAHRGKTLSEDENIKQQLSNSQKEKSENVMIVDLVRNDLSKTAERNSVVVEELFSVRTFSRLHQMISTVGSKMRSDVDGVNVIKNAFPMGSMTGAPKVRAMQLIEEYENTKRGLYSGAVGYISPSGDFDFNVVIRSILYNVENNYLSFMVGSAITAASDAEKEYEECLLKAEAMIQTLKREKI